MTQFEIIEIGNGPWCNPIEAANFESALEIVAADLRDANPADYIDDYAAGDDLPTVEVSIRNISTDEQIIRTMIVGG